MKIEIWSDIACPWCYIGKRRFERALELLPESPEIEVLWRSFELDPTAPTAVDQSLDEILSRKYGMSLSQARQMQERITAVATEEGLNFRFEAFKPGNTFTAHRLIHFAHTEGKQDAMKERLLLANFTEGASMADQDALTRAAADVGLETEAVREVLSTDAFAREVRADEERAREIGIHGVPFFLINEEYGISGAQPAEVFTNLLARIQNQSPDPRAKHGPGCDDQGCEIQPS